MKKKKLKVIILAILIVAACITMYAVMEYYRKNESLAEIKPAYTVSADNLIQEFTVNAPLAGKKYLGKVIDVHGLCKGIEQDSHGYYTVVLSGEIPGTSIRGTIDSTMNNQTLMLKPPVHINIRGMLTGYNPDELGLGADILLNRCILIK
jgi:hypothetical protein